MSKVNYKACRILHDAKILTEALFTSFTWQIKLYSVLVTTSKVANKSNPRRKPLWNARTMQQHIISPLLPRHGSHFCHSLHCYQVCKQYTFHNAAYAISKLSHLALHMRRDNFAAMLLRLHPFHISDRNRTGSCCHRSC